MQNRSSFWCMWAAGCGVMRTGETQRWGSQPVTSKFQLVLIASLITWLPLQMAQAAPGKELPRIDQRFAQPNSGEQPDFQRHIMPLLGRLGCSGRACHGSFQGRGGFRLSLFGYDFQADYAALFDKESPRVDLKDPDESLIIYKPTHEDEHEGGLRYEHGSWQYNVLHQWIAEGATYDAKKRQKLARLDITPSEILFQKAKQSVPVKVVAVWQDGSREDVTPLCRFRTNNDEVATIDENGRVASVKPGDTHVVVFYDIGVQPVPVLRPVSDRVASRYPKVPTPTEIDRLVVEKLRKLGVVPSELCSDSEFLRRVSLDLTGTLPTPDEVKQFLADASPDKRDRKIDELLASPGYAAWWTTRLCDYTGNNDTQLTNVVPTRNGVASQDWYDWIHKRVAENAPYDELVAGILTAESRRSDQDYTDYCRQMSEIYRKGGDREFADLECMPYYWARRDFRQPEARAIGVAYTFLGIRIQCAQCHKHPFDQWSKKDFAQFQTFFTGVVASNRPQRQDQAEYNQMLKQLGVSKKRGGDLRRELQKALDQGKTIPFPEVYTVSVARKGRTTRKGKQPAAAPVAKLPGDQVVDLAKYDDPRTALMDWMRAKDNPYFARAFANRVWANYFGTGIVDPPDDMSLANPPSNAPLLDYLAHGFIEHKFDMKWLHREITRSRTYQLSWTPNETNEADHRNFSHAVARRLPAEVLYDAVRQATASDQQLAETHDSLEGRAVAVPGTGNRRANDQRYALTVFGRSVRESNCDCDRSSEPSLLQTLYLQNDRDMQNALLRKDGWIAEIAKQAGESISSGPKKPANYDKMVGELQKRIGRLRKAGNTKQATLQQKRLSQLVRRYGRPAGAGKSTTTTNKLDLDSLVRDAYLRTLSREPDPLERETAVQYVGDAKNVSTGMRDVLWALVNTKEFIVNH